jgi:hypothetical protein
MGVLVGDSPAQRIGPEAQTQDEPGNCVSR